MPLQTISKEVRIDGRVVPNVLEVSSSAGFQQINAEATIWATARPSWASEGSAVNSIWVKNSATGEDTIFGGGEIASFDWTYAPTKVGIVCQDLLARTRQEWGGDIDIPLDPDFPPEIQPGSRVYENQDDAAIIRNLLEAMAIPSSAAHIESSAWTLGTVQPVVLKQGDTVYSLIERIDNLAGFRTFTLTNGTIMRQRISGAPGTRPSMVFERGVQILSSPRRSRTKLGIVNRVIVTGLSYEGLVVGGPGVGEFAAENPYISDPPKYITSRIQDDLVEDDAKALEIATREVADKNRRPESYDFAIPLDPRVQAGMTVQIIHPDLEAGSVLVFVQTVAHNVGADAKTTIRTTGALLSGPVTTPPIASFALQTILEGEDTGSGVEARVVVIADGSASYDPDGTITGYAWVVTTDGTASVASSTAPILRTVLSDATTVTVELTVTDDDGLTGVLTLTQPLDATTMLVEDLYGADESGAPSCSSDGEQTWRTQTPASGVATCLMPFAPAWGQLWGTDSGHVYATFDKLRSALVDLGQPHGAVACTAVWVHETQTDLLWAGFADGAVYAGGLDIPGQIATWNFHSTMPESPIVEIRASIAAPGELRATAGQGYYFWGNGTLMWALQHTFDVAWRMAAGFDLNLASGLNDPAPLYSETGSPPTVPGGVEHIRGLSFGWRQQELYAADDAAGLYIADSTFAALIASADTTPAIVNHMVRSGNVDRVVYMAVGDGSGDNGFVKWIPDAVAPFFVRRTGTDAGLMIGYGPLHPPELVVQFEIILIPAAVVGSGQDGAHHYVPGVGWSVQNSGLPTRGWNGVSVNGLNPAQWLAWSDSGSHVDGSLILSADDLSPIYATLDNGATFVEVEVRAPPGMSAVTLNLRPEWSETVAGQIVMIGGGTFFTLWRGTVADGLDGTMITAGLANQWQYGMANGLNGDVLNVADFTDVIGTRTAVIAPSGAVTYTPPPLAISGQGALLHIDRMGGVSRALVAVSSSELWAASDYGSVPLTMRVDLSPDAVYDVAATSSAAYLGTSDGIVQIVDPTGGAVATTVAAAGTGIHAVRTDRQLRTAVAGLEVPGAIQFAVIHVYDGAAWTSFPGPSTLYSNYFADSIEIIARSVPG